MTPDAPRVPRPRRPSPAGLVARVPVSPGPTPRRSPLYVEPDSPTALRIVPSPYTHPARHRPADGTLPVRHFVDVSPTSPVTVPLPQHRPRPTRQPVNIPVLVLIVAIVVAVLAYGIPTYLAWS